MMMTNPTEQFGNIDIYLFDQILKNRFNQNAKILDAGCGSGRNLYYFLRNGFEVFGIDQDTDAIDHNISMAKVLSPELPTENFQISSVEKMPFESEKFDVVISSAVLHFAENLDQFNAMFLEMWRVLKPQGILFARLATSIGIEHLIEPTDSGRFLLPDGSERFLATERMLVNISNEINCIWLEPLKTTNVQNLRCMSTVVWQKQ
jgi:tellurite methyltransferase